MAGLALLATLLVSILIAFGRHAGQIRAAERRLQAIDAAHRLLSEWTAADTIPAVGDEDLIEGTDNLWWRVTSDTSDAQLPRHLQTVNLEIVQRTGFGPAKVATSIRLVLANPQQESGP